MKGLLELPTTRQISSAYFSLESGPVNPERLVQLSQWSRLDARLAELIIKNVLLHWRRYSPVEVNDRLRHSPWPPALATLLELTEPHIPKRDSALFAAWKECALATIEPAKGELYFFGTRFPGSKLALKDVTLSLKPYSRWGYYGRDPLSSKIEPQKRTLVDRKKRMRVLSELLQKKQTISVKEYRAAFSNLVSPRVAELDLKTHPRLRPIGKTKGRLYSLSRRRG